MSASHRLSENVSPLTLPSPKISSSEAERIVAKHFGIEGRAQELAGEKDDNFRLLTADGSLFLKVVHAGEPALATDFVTSALIHLERVAPELPVQRVIPVRGGGPELHFRTAAGEDRTARLTSFVDGRILHSVPTTASLRVSLGAILARLGQALLSFSHAGAEREMLWDLQNAGQVWPMLEELRVPERDLLASCLTRFESEVKPRLLRQRKQILHNDLSGDNVVIGLDTEAIEGVIDFGDMIATQVVNDVSIAAANQLADGDDPFGPAIDLVRGYHELEPLSPEEMSLIYDLVRTRTALHIVISEWRSARFPENRKYVMRKTPRAWSLLRAMPDAAEPEATARLIENCRD